MRAFVFLLSAFIALECCAEHRFGDQYTKESLPTYFDWLASRGYSPGLPNLYLNELSRVGHIGRLSFGSDTASGSYVVFQQVEGGTMVQCEHIERAYSLPSDSSGPGQRFPEKRWTSGPWLFKNAGIEGLPDGATFDPKGCWEITGTHQYQNTLGSTRTVFVIEPVPDGKIKIPEKFPHKYLLKYPARDWHMLDGSLFCKGIHLGYQDGIVWVMDMDSEIKKESLFKLSKDDQQFIRDQIKARRRTWLIPEYEREQRELKKAEELRKARAADAN
jgi:hypothetical protein